MSAFLMDELDRINADVIDIALGTRSATRAKVEPKSLQELKVHYLNFCVKRDLDHTVPPEEQMVYCDKDQLWLDAHLVARNHAIKEKRLFARGKTNFLREMLAKIADVIGYEPKSTNNTKNVATPLQTVEVNTTPLQVKVIPSEHQAMKAAVQTHKISGSALIHHPKLQQHTKPKINNMTQHAQHAHEKDRRQPDRQGQLCLF